MNKITPFLWFDGKAEEAAKFYVSIFKKGKIISSSPMMVTFEIEGQKIMALNGGPMYKFTEAFSFYVECKDQKEVDYFWDKLSEEGEPGQCGWLKDKFGLSWQIIPEALGTLMGDEDEKKSERVLQAMLKMKKIKISELEEAYNQK